MQLGSWVGAARKAAQGRPCRLRRRGGKEDLGGVEAKTSGQKRECNEAGGKHSINRCQLLRKGHDGTGPTAQQFDNQPRSARAVVGSGLRNLFISARRISGSHELSSAL